MELFTSSVYCVGPPEDAVFMDQVLLQPRTGLLMVADAPGPGDDGRAAVRLAMEVVRQNVERNLDLLARFRRHPSAELRRDVLGVVEASFARAAQEVFAFARRRVGVLVVMDVLLLVGSEAFIGHIGDGRVYLVRRGLVHQLTVDHVATDDVFRKEGITAQIGDRPFTRALGPTPQVRVESLCMEITSEDRFMVCSSHLTRAIPGGILNNRLTSYHLEELGQILQRDGAGRPLLAACAQLDSPEAFASESARSRLAMLAPIPLFAHCTERELRSVAQATRPQRMPANTMIFRQGEEGKDLYLVVSGSVDIIKNGHTIVTLHPGSNFGEMAMLDQSLRSASARTATDSELLVIPQDAFFALLKGNPNLAVKILWNMLLRLSSNLRRTSEKLASTDEDATEIGGTRR